MIYIFAAMILYTVAILVGAAASRNLHPVITSAVMNTVAAAIPIAAMVPLIGKKVVVGSGLGIWLAIAAGALIALFTLAITKSYAENKIGIVAPMIFGGAILLSTVLSALIYKEKISVIEGVGLAVLAVGFAIITYARATTA